MNNLPISRERSPIAVLLDPERDIPLGERDIRVEDYVNDKIQTASDLGSIESLIASVELQKQQLQEQLRDAKSKLAEAKRASTNRTSSMLEQTNEFEKQHENVQKRLMIVTSSETPEEATRRLKRPLEKLRKVQLAQAYVELLNEVETLKNDARSHLPANPKEALKSYTQLKQLAISLEQLQEPAEGAAVHLVNYVQKTSSGLWTEMKQIMSAEFESVLQKSKWPDATSETTKEWSDCFEKLLDLQTPEIMATREPLILLPISVMAKTFVLQFKYHFFSDKPTNDPQNLGSLFFEWFLQTIDKWEDFLRENVGPLLATHFRETPLAGSSLYVDPVAALITALLPVMKEKVDSLIPKIANDPQRLSQFMVQLMSFDDAIRTRFNYDGGCSEFGWRGLTWKVLDTWFDPWLEAEKNFAMKRYHDILRTPNSRLIDYDSSGPRRTKATYGAMQVADLISTVTLQYNKLRKFSHKVRFLIGIQAEILDQYLGVLRDSLEAYQMSTSTVGRALHGISKEQQEALEGVGRLETLCKVFGSSEHLISVLKDWSNEEFFVDLWDQLQNRAKVTTAESNLAGEMTYTEVKESTSDAVGSEDDGSVFDVTIASFERLRNRAEALLVQAIKSLFPTTFRPYITKTQWWMTVGEAPLADEPQTITAELDHPLHILEQNISFLRRALADAPFRRIWRDSLQGLQELLYNDVLMRQNFTTLGASRFTQDVAAMKSVIDRSMQGTSSPFSMLKLEEAAYLLNLPIEDENNEKTLQGVYSEVFSDGQAAQHALQSLAITHLSNKEARAVLARRVEANSD